MSNINDSIINNSFGRGDQNGSGGDQEFELHAGESQDHYTGQEFAGSMHEGEFEAVEQKRRFSPRKLAVAISLVLATTGGAYYLATTLHAGNKGSADPDFSDLKTAMQAGQLPAPMTAPGVNAEGVAPAVSMVAGDQAAVVAQVANDQNTVVTPGADVVSSAPTIPASPIAQVSVAPTANPAQAPSTSAAPVAATPVAPAPALPVVASPPVAAPAPVAVTSAAPTPAKVAPAAPAVAKATSATIEKKTEPAVVAVKKTPVQPGKEVAVKRENPSTTRAAEQVNNSTSESAVLLSDVKPLITVTANQIGLKSLTKDMLLVANGPATQRYLIGDLLPSGERIMFIDSHAATIVTDKQIIRVAN